MNKKTLLKISTLQNSIVANNSIMQSHPELVSDLSDNNEKLMNELEEVKNPLIKVEKKGEVEIGKDLGWNCIAVQKNGNPCPATRKHGKYCGRHLIYYVEELEAKRMIEVKEKDIGRKVIYRSGHQNQEEGVITSFNKHGVFVRYGSNTGSQSTRREDLEYEC